MRATEKRQDGDEGRSMKKGGEGGTEAARGIGGKCAWCREKGKVKSTLKRKRKS